MYKLSKVKFILVIFCVLLFPETILASNFGIRPAYPRADNPRTESIFIQTLEPGSSAQEGVRVINNSSEEKKLLLYAKDSVRSSGGGFACIQFRETSKNVGNWIKFNIENIAEDDKSSIKSGEIQNSIEISIPAGQEIIIPFTISAPKDVSVGEHNGCILIQEIKSRSESAGVSLSLRSGTRVAINIPGEIFKKLEISDFKIEKRNKSVYLMPSVKNTGNVSIDSKISVNVKNFLGLNHKTFGGDFPVLREEIYDFNFELKKPFWGGLYFAQAIFEYDGGTDGGIGTQSQEKSVVLNSEKVWFFSSPTMLGLIIEIFILLTLLVVFAIWRLNKKKKKWIRKWVQYEVQDGETLEIISRKFKVHWEIIVEVNKIKPPFVLKTGELIKVPPKRNKK
jgi:LysM repeat protein